MKYTADFETTTNPDDLRVWAWALCTIEDDPQIITGTNIATFFNTCCELNVKVCYFHNLKFDGEFILSSVLKSGFKYRELNVQKHEKLNPRQFATLISDTGIFYKISVCFANGYAVEFLDSLKIITMPVEKVAKTFSLPISKLHIDYKEYRAKWHKLTSIEQAYIENDVKIMALALNQIFKMGYTKMTQGSNALADYRFTLTGDKNGKMKFKDTFPVPEYDKDIRQSYRGGWTYLNPCYADKDVGKGVCLDVNSLYPSRMYYELLPFNAPVQYKGEPKQNVCYPLYIHKFKCEFNIRKNKLPTFQLKNNMGFGETEYVESSKEKTLELCMCKPDFELFLEHYDVTNIEHIGGYAFMGSTNLFTEYIDKWMDIKIKAEKEGNSGMRQWAKIMLNSLYGKFALNPNTQKKIPFLDDNNIVRYKMSQPEIREPVYLPVGTFITAYARCFTIRAAQKVRDYSMNKYGVDMFIYSDTDSIKTLLPIDDCKEFLEIDPTKLGAWKHEDSFERARFLRAKSYIEEINGRLSVACCGMPEKSKQYVSWDNFKFGSVFGDKLRPARYENGVVLEETTFEIKRC